MNCLNDHCETSSCAVAVFDILNKLSTFNAHRTVPILFICEHEN